MVCPPIRQSRLPSTRAAASSHGRQATGRTSQPRRHKSAIARGITSAYEYQIAATWYHDMTTLISTYHNNSEVSSLHSGPDGRKRGRTKQQVQRTPIEYISSNEETSFADQSNYPNHCTYLTLDSRRTNTMTTSGSRTSFGITSSNAPGTNARTNSGTSREAPAAEIVSVTHTLRDINAEVAAEYNEGGSGEYPTPQTPPSSSSRQQLLHYLVTNWKSLALGQVLSILLSTAGITQSTLYASCGLSAPTLSVAFVYLINSFHLCRLRNRRRRGERLSADADIDDDWSARLETIGESNSGASNDPSASSTAKASASKGAEILRMSSQPTHTFCGLQINAPPWMYIILAFLDVEANYLTVLAYRYTTLTSVTLFDALAIPSAMVLSKWWLGRAYGRIHLVGVALCMVGVVVNVMQDYKIVNEDDDDGTPYDDDGSTNGDPYPFRIRGDILAICGGILYGVNDTVCEIAVRAHGHASEFLGMVGLFAGIIAIVQAAIVEREAIAEFFSLGANSLDDDACSAFSAWGLLTAFVAVNVVSYSGAAMFLLLSEAAFFNLSLLTGDLWTVIFSVTAQHIIPGTLFFVALVLIVGGVVVYEMAPSPVNSTKVSEENGRPRDDSFEMTQGIVESLRYQSGELT